LSTSAHKASHSYFLNLSVSKEQAVAPVDAFVHDVRRTVFLKDNAMNDAFSAGPLELTSDVVSAYVSNNRVPAAELPALIASVHEALGSLGKTEELPAEDHRATPAQIRKSITPDALISFVDGRGYKSLKRHLAKHELTPDEYRAKYGLPRDYPMVSEAYSAMRADLARSLGLGQRRREAAKATAAEPTRKSAGKPGRPRKAAAQ
jgi:predicted transcriptional regulator